MGELKRNLDWRITASDQAVVFSPDQFKTSERMHLNVQTGMIYSR